MNWLDVIIIILLVASIFGGLKNGLVRSLLSLAGLIVGINLAGRYYLAVAARLAFIHQEKAAHIVAFVIIVLAVMLVAALVGLLLAWIIASVMLGWLDRIGGAIFGLVIGALSIGALLAVWVKFAGTSKAVTGSSLATFLLDQVPVVLALLPDEFGVIRSFFR